MAKKHRRIPKHSRSRKLTVIVSSQTAYHLQLMADSENCPVGRVVDKMTRDWQLGLKAWRD